MSAAPETLYLLDGMALVYRAHWAMVRSPRLTSRGMNTSGPFGYSNTVYDLLRQRQPTHIAVAFDTRAPTHRHLAYEPYKANREAMPEELSAGLPYIERITEAWQIPTLRCDGYEADDIIGTLARRAEAAGLTTYMVTPDKDFAQLVSPTTFIYKPGRLGGDAEILGVAEILEKWGIERIEQVIDILGLQGDSSDNIPGIPGIGPKTAQKLIARFGSVEELLANADQLKGKQKENVTTYADQALLSKQLATICCEVPLAVQPADLVRSEPDEPALRAIFEELEFQALGKRVFGTGFATGGRQPDLFGETAAETAAAATTTFKTIADVPHTYHIVRTPAERAQLLARLHEAGRFCLDFETTGRRASKCELVGLAACCQAHEAWYLPFSEDPKKAAAELAEFAPLLARPDVELIGHNVKFDLTLLRWRGIRFRGRVFDTMLAHFLIAPELRHKLDAVAEAQLGYRPISIAALIGEKGHQISMREVPLELVAEYAAEDADVAWQLAAVLAPLLDEHELRRAFDQAEAPLVPVLVEMEHAGVALDVPQLQAYAKQLDDEAVDLHAKIIEAAGVAFNLDSPKQLGEVLFDHLQLEEKPRKTATGQYQTREQTLQILAGRHPIVQDIMDYRTVRKLKSTYADTLPAHLNAETGRLHTNYNQAATVTGRLQSNAPNLQNIPIRTEKGREIRKAFVPGGSEYLLLSADYSQIELRIIAHLSQDPAMVQAFVDGEDIHRATAARVYDLAPDDVTSEMRSKAKMVNFGLAYGMTAFGLAQRLNVPRKEAKELIDVYFTKYPGIREYMDETVAYAREHGYVKTMLGRRRYLPDINSSNFTTRGQAERFAINSPIQGTAADMIKIAMNRIQQAIDDGGYRTRMLLQVHDELVFELHHDEELVVPPMIRQHMVEAMPMGVPIVVDMGIGRDWLEAH